MGLEPLNETSSDKKILSEDFSYIANAGKGRITSRFGYRIHPISKRKKFHHGLDIAHPTGTEVLAMADGVVIQSEMADNKCGGTIAVDHGDINGKKIKTRFCHNSKLLKKIGDNVKKGDVIAISGGGKGDPGRGGSTGPHIHFEVYENGKTVDPRPYYDGTVKVTTQNLDTTKTNKKVSNEPSKVTSSEIIPMKPLSYYMREAQKLLNMPEEEQDGKFGKDSLKALKDLISRNS
jgi:murein DD-endopeptidase MepM/ murein hydrolase activator NlpD